MRPRIASTRTESRNDIGHNRGPASYLNEFILVCTKGKCDRELETCILGRSDLVFIYMISLRDLEYFWEKERTNRNEENEWNRLATD